MIKFIKENIEIISLVVSAVITAILTAYRKWKTKPIEIEDLDIEEEEIEHLEEPKIIELDYYFKSFSIGCKRIMNIARLEDLATYIINRIDIVREMQTDRKDYIVSMVSLVEYNDKFVSDIKKVIQYVKKNNSVCLILKFSKRTQIKKLKLELKKYTKAIDKAGDYDDNIKLIFGK